jgi:hypothetical protein
LRRWRWLLGAHTTGGRHHGAGGTGTENHASRQGMVRQVFAGQHRLLPFVGVESVGVTPNP